MVDTRIPSQAEKEKKCLRGLAELLIRIARMSPHSFMQHLGPFLPFGVSQLEKEVLKIHKEREDKVKKFLKGFEGKVSISYDLLTYDDEYNNGLVWHKDFVCISVHFLDHTSKVGKWILGYYPIEYVRGDKVLFAESRMFLWIMRLRTRSLLF